MQASPNPPIFDMPPEVNLLEEPESPRERLFSREFPSLDVLTSFDDFDFPLHQVQYGTESSGPREKMENASIKTIQNKTSSTVQPRQELDKQSPFIKP